MNKKVYVVKPHLKINERSIEQGDTAYISFEESINIPGLENADIRIEFERNNSLEEISQLVSKLRASGFKFIVQK